MTVSFVCYILFFKIFNKWGNVKIAQEKVKRSIIKVDCQKWFVCD